MCKNIFFIRNRYDWSCFLSSHFGAAKLLAIGQTVESFRYRIPFQTPEIVQFELSKTLSKVCYKHALKKMKPLLQAVSLFTSYPGEILQNDLIEFLISPLFVFAAIDVYTEHKVPY